MSIEFLPVEDEPLQHCYISTMSGVPIYGTHWPPTPQAYRGTSNLAHFGASSQATTIAQMVAQQVAQQFAFSQPAALNSWGPESEPEPIEDAGISAGEIIAHRAWRIRGGSLLQSMAADDLWSPTEPMEGKPSTACYGVHAFKLQSRALTYSSSVDLVAIGTVLLWGEVIEHEDGYRAEFAKVNSIDMIRGVGRLREWWILKLLRRIYGV